MALSKTAINRLGFIILGLANNFAYVIMLSAAYDLLKDAEDYEDAANNPVTAEPLPTIKSFIASDIEHNFTSSPIQVNETEQPFCNHYSTSTILLADSLPSLTTKLLYPFILARLPTAYKAVGAASLSAASFLITGLCSNRILIFIGVSCASFACGLGETTLLSNAPRYGIAAISGWSAGTGISGLLSAMAYAVLRIVLPIKVIMILMLVIPVSMLMAYFFIIIPIEDDSGRQIADKSLEETKKEKKNKNIDPVGASVVSHKLDEDQKKPIWSSVETNTQHGAHDLHMGTATITPVLAKDQQVSTLQPLEINDHRVEPFNYKAKILFLPKLIKYFAPLFLVYYGEFFINQGLHELIYYPEITYLDHAAQYRWYQVVYQFGVMISRASLDLLVIRHLWTMALLQVTNALIFLAHTAKLFHIPNFYVVIVMIGYEGLLGGFIYSNTFYRMKEELSPDRQEFGISTVVIADTLGIVLAGLTAIPVHDSLCKLYN